MSRADHNSCERDDASRFKRRKKRRRRIDRDFDDAGSAVIGIEITDLVRKMAKSMSLGERGASFSRQVDLSKSEDQLWKNTISKSFKEINAGLRFDDHREIDILKNRLSMQQIRDARSIVKGFKENGISAVTRQRYEKLSERLSKTGLSPEQISGTKKSFYAYRAAEVYRHKSNLKDALKERDKSFRAKNNLDTKKAEDRIRESMAFFSRYQPGGTREENMQRSTRVRIDETAIRSNGKRESVSNLPSDWRERVWNSVAPKDQDVIAVTAVTGLRPSELEKGVQIKRIKGNLEFRIQGTKIDEKRGKGQIHRTIKVSETELRNSDEGRHLIQAQRSQLRQVKLEGSGKAFGARISRAGARAKLDEKVSPYTYRHAFSARLKAAGKSPEEIARAMGHQAERSQQEYGRRSQAKNAGAGGIVSASAAKPIRSRR